MHSHLGPVVGLLVALTWADLSAQQSACTLLTPEDIETITGAKPMAEPHKTNIVIPEGPQKGQTLNGCMWSTTGNGMVSVSMMPAPEGVSREAGMVMSSVFMSPTQKLSMEQTRALMDKAVSRMQ